MVSIIVYMYFSRQDRFSDDNHSVAKTRGLLAVLLANQEDTKEIEPEDTPELFKTSQSSSTTRVTNDLYHGTTVRQDWSSFISTDSRGAGRQDKLLKQCPATRKWSVKESNHEWKKLKEALEEYAVFHQQQAERIGSGDLEVRTISYVCEDKANCFGIGDQFNRILQILLLAVASNRVLFLDWGEESTKTFKYLLPNRVNWSMKLSSVVLKQYPIFKKLKIKDYLGFMRKVRSDSYTHIRTSTALQVPFRPGINQLLRTDPSMLEKLSLNQILNTVSLDVFNGELLRYLFTFSQEVLRKVDNAQKQMEIFHKPYIGVHIRTGFLGTEHEEVGHFSKYKIFRTEDVWLNTIKCSLHLSDISSVPDSGKMALYLATDSYRVKELADKEHDRRIKTLNMTLQHVAIHSVDEHNSRQTADERQESEFDRESSQGVGVVSGVDGHMATWIDFLLLARADILVQSTSGFSVAAGDFCSTVKKHFYIPNCRNKRHSDNRAGVFLSSDLNVQSI